MKSIDTVPNWAFWTKVLAAVCLFPTDVHKGSLGSAGDDSMARIAAGDISPPKELTLIFGKQDNHIPPDGRVAIYQALVAAGVDFQWVELNAQHAFIRDELSKGRYDPALTEIARQTTVEVFRRRLTFGTASAAVVTPQKTSSGPANC